MSDPDYIPFGGIRKFLIALKAKHTGDFARYMRRGRDVVDNLFEIPQSSSTGEGLFDVRFQKA
ncbi:hypothetical protein [Psychromarinibacter halotolerans]|uniref:hypothetical protein n=1 Tax=Psychromarinibacter halotolerans TaxID=1775175 RepID=UPI0023D82ACF|nr:hypothetical protein [Psychromarinibacter halotolerans]